MDDDLARVTDPAYLDGVERLDAPALRALRDECRAVERRLSFARRVLQGHLDLAAAELARREVTGARGALADTAGTPDATADRDAAFVDGVALVLRGPAATGSTGAARAVGLHPADLADDRWLADVDTAASGDMDDAELRALVARLSRRERDASRHRVVLLDHLDRLQAALVARYRARRALVDEVVGAGDGRS